MLPPDTLVLLSTYFQDSTGRNFIPAEEAAAVAKWADARAKSASSCRAAHTHPMPAPFHPGAPQPMYQFIRPNWRAGGGPGSRPLDTVFLDRPRTPWTECCTYPAHRHVLPGAGNRPRPDQRNYLKKIQSASQHLLGIINDILDDFQDRGRQAQPRTGRVQFPAASGQCHHPDRRQGGRQGGWS